MLKASGNVKVDWLTDLCNSMIQEKKTQEDWRRIILDPVTKGKVVHLNVVHAEQLNLWSMA